MKSDNNDYSKILIKSDLIKIKILDFLSDYKEHTPSEIANYLKTNTKTILNNCYFLKLMGIIQIDEKKTKRTNYYIKLKEGFKLL